MELEAILWWGIGLVEFELSFNNQENQRYDKFIIKSKSRILVRTHNFTIRLSQMHILVKNCVK